MNLIRHAEMNSLIFSFALTLSLAVGMSLIPQSVLAQQKAPPPPSDQNGIPDVTVTPDTQQPGKNSQLGNGEGESEREEPPGCRYERKELELLV